MSNRGLTPSPVSDNDEVTFVCGGQTALPQNFWNGFSTSGLQRLLETLVCKDLQALAVKHPPRQLSWNFLSVIFLYFGVAGFMGLAFPDINGYQLGQHILGII